MVHSGPLPVVLPLWARIPPYRAAMTDLSKPHDPATTSAQVPTQPPAPAPVPSYAPPSAVAQAYAGPVGKVRGTGVAILLAIVTFGIYTLVWTYSVHKEMKEHTGQGLGGGLALLLQFFVGIVMPYVTSSEVGSLYARAGREPRTSGATGLWYFPGIFILVGPIVWFVKTNGAINDYWKSLGAPA